MKHYEILSSIGKGGMGVVYRARDTRLGRVVALKMLHEEVARDEERSKRFEREARIISNLSHPGIATLYEFDREGEVAFLAMELVDGPTLRDLLAEGPLPLDRALDCALQVADALAAAHREGVIHRDLKPENIMVAGTGHYKVLDFGVARMDQPGEDGERKGTQTPTLSWATRSGGIVGTLAYMSPEQALGEPVDARSDVFSFGSLLYELLAGSPPFRGKNEIATAHAVVQDRHEPLRRARAGLPEGLELIVDKCLAKRPAHRYPSAESLVEDLRELHLASLTGTRRSSRLLAYRTSARRSRRRGLAAAAIGLVAVAAVAWIWKPWRVLGVETPSAEASATALPAMSAKPRVIVAFFENNSGDPEADWLSRGLPEMLTTDLSRSEQLDVIATQRLYDLAAVAGENAGPVLDRSRSAELARWAGADIVISGSVFKAGQVYRIDAQAYDTRNGSVAAAHKVEGTELFSMVDELTAGLLGGFQLADRHEGQLQRVTTSSEEAFRLYTRGRSLYDNLQFEQAADAFRGSLEADPTFGLARLRLATSLLAAGEEKEALPLIDRAAEDADRMPRSEGLLALALRAYYVRNDLAAGTARIEELLRQYPRDEEAYILWARALRDLAGRQLEAVGKLRRAIDQDPGNLPAIAELASQLAEMGERDAARTILEESARRNPQAAAGLERLIRTHGG